MTKYRIKTLCFGKSDVIKLTKALDVSKAHDHDGISIKIIKICADTVAHPLTLIFQNSLAAGIFANDWKKANIVPIHKKMINKLFQITDQFLFYQYVVKSLKSSFLMNSLRFLRRETCYLSISLVFVLAILVFTSCLQLRMTFFLFLTLILFWKPAEYSYTYENFR